MASTTGQNPQRPSEDGKRILYRLLLIAVAVVYVLVFVLDYVLHFRFTYFLVVSLFLFVMVTLAYMWFKVAGKPMPEEEKPPVSPSDGLNGFSPFVPEWPEAVFKVNQRTGLTMEANAAAVKLLGVRETADLIGVDLYAYFEKPWSPEEHRSFRDRLREKRSATAPVIIRTAIGTSFNALMVVDVIAQGDGSVLLVRLQSADGYPSSYEKVIPKPEGALRSAYEESAFPMVMIGKDYKIKSANKAFCIMLAYREHEMEGMNYLDLIHPDDREQERFHLSRLFRGEASAARREKRLQRRTNEWMWLSLSSSLQRDEKGAPGYIMTLAENITQRKRMEMTVAESRNRLHGVIDNHEYGIFSVDRHHTLQLLNPRLADFFFTMTGVVVEPGFNLLDLIPGPFRKEYLDLHARAFHGESVVVEKELATQKGKNHLEVVINPVRNPQGAVTTVSFFVHDVTSRKSAEEELLHARQKAEESTEAKTNFLATMSHEIRTPLNGVIGMGKLLNQTSLSPKQREYVDSILLSGEALLSVINDILDISKIESAKMELERKPFALKRCVEETFDLLASKAIEKKLTLSYSIAPGTPAFIMGDITRLRQILMNLVSNAIKFTQRGGIVVYLSKVQEIDRQQQLLIEVKDTGIGIPADRIDRLFRSYSQVDASTSRTYGGTGLGLAICKNLVELMGGTIWVKSKLGEGSVFSFTLQAEAAGAMEAARDLRTGSKRLANARVLIVGDDKVSAAMYADYFTRWNMTPQIVSDPTRVDEALSGGEAFTLALIDAQLMTMNPLLVAESIRSHRSKNQLPIVLFNSDQAGRWIMNYTHEVISAVLPKDVDRSKVLDVLLGIFTLEEHQRSKHDEGLRSMGAKLAQTIPARILIAEDNQINQKLAQNIFEGLGYHPVIVSNGREVIDRLRTEEFDIIFMDVQMPELDGLEATRFILNKMVLPKRPHIIAMTAFALEGDKEKCMDAGMDDYISKPFMIEEIVDQIKKWYDPGNAAQPSFEEATATIASRPVIDVKILNNLREMTAGTDPDFFFRVIRMFLDQAEQVVVLMEESLRYGNLMELSSQAHKLKGSALNIGASRLAEHCKQLEIQARGGETAGLIELLSQIKAEAKTAEKELSSIKG